MIQRISLNKCECGKCIHAKGMCRKHYNRDYKLRKYPDMLTNGTIGEPAVCHPNRLRRYRNGLCSSCYNRQRGHDTVDFKTMYNEQEGLCKACNDYTSEDLMKVDHNHSTLKVRGLLCHKCNLIAGSIETSRFQKVLDYLEHTDA